MMPYRLVKLLTIRYPPDTVYLLFLCVVSGLSQLTDPREALPMLPIWISILWLVVLTTGSVVSLVGIFWRNYPTGCLIERAGRTMLWPASLAFAVVLWKYSTFDLSSVLVLAFGINCLVRSVYINRVYVEWQRLMTYDTQRSS